MDCLQRYAILIVVTILASVMSELTGVTEGTEPLQKKLKPSAVPSVFFWTKEPLQSDIQRGDRRIRREVQGLLADLVSSVESRIELESVCTGPVVEDTVVSEVCSVDTTFAETSVQTENPQLTEVGSQTCDVPRAAWTASSFAGDDKGIHFYTGLETYKKFCFVFSTLCPAAFSLNYYQGVSPMVPVLDQFFITLIKLRRNNPYFELSRMFKVSEACISNIFVTWVNFMYVHWSEQPWWPARDVVKYYTPSDFKRKYPSTRCVVDGTECPIQKPHQPIAQQATYSTYKNRNTVKVLVGVTPGGLVSHVTTAYGGSTSDRQIVERSTIPQSCDSGDSLMADKGFNVQDIFVPYNVIINIPTFFSNTNRMSCETVMKDRQIASKRVHVERIIGLGKTYNILKSPMDNTQSALSSRIIFVCYTLSNFRRCIVSKNA